MMMMADDVDASPKIERAGGREGGSRRSTAASDACPQIERERGEREGDKILYLAKQKILKHFRNCEAL